MPNESPSTEKVSKAHTSRMRRVKEQMDRRMAEASVDRGVFVVNSGDGKGKSSSGFGMVARALGHGMRVGVVQFIKGNSQTGESLFFGRFPEEVSFVVAGEGFTWETQNRERDCAVAEAGWDEARKFLRDPSIGLVLLDELCIALQYRYLSEDVVIADILKRPVSQHVVVTGRGASPVLMNAADTVTQMMPLKHAFAAGIRAQRGTEW